MYDERKEEDTGIHCLNRTACDEREAYFFLLILRAWAVLNCLISWVIVYD